MKLIADEGVDQPIVAALRKAGFSVVYYAEEAPGTDDAAVLARASSAGGLLLTCDKDFGELVYRNRMTTAGVVLLRLSGMPQASKVKLVLEALASHAPEMLGAFTVISPGLLRIRPRQ